MQTNINTKEYWESRFKSTWNDNGELQTREYAKANVSNMNLSSSYRGTILDFGCALGNAIPVYKERFPNAKISGIDISEVAVKKCKERYGGQASFNVGEVSNVVYSDVVIASHVMEHVSNDKKVVRELLTKCQDLFIFVPYKETPLFVEHVNYYDEEYYNDFTVIQKSIFAVEYRYPFQIKSVLKSLLRFKFKIHEYFKKDIIMFHLKGFGNTN